jgi:hypothetical protein
MAACLKPTEGAMGLANGEIFTGPYPDEFTRIYPLREDGTIDDWWFEGGGDFGDPTMEQCVDDYANENPDVKFVEVTFGPVGSKPYEPEKED